MCYFFYYKNSDKKSKCIFLFFNNRDCTELSWYYIVSSGNLIKSCLHVPKRGILEPSIIMHREKTPSRNIFSAPFKSPNALPYHSLSSYNLILMRVFEYQRLPFWPMRDRFVHWSLFSDRKAQKYVLGQF